MELIRRKEKKLLDELDTLTEKQTEELKCQIKSAEIDLQTYQQYQEIIKQVLHSDSPIDLYDMYTLCQSGEITADIQIHDEHRENGKSVHFKYEFDVNELDKTLQFGRLWNNLFEEDKSTVQRSPGLLSPVPVPTHTKSKSSFNRKSKLLSMVNFKTADDKEIPYAGDIEIVNISGRDTLVIIDNDRVKACYSIDFKPYCTSLQFKNILWTLTKVGQDIVAVSYWSRNIIELIKLTPDPVLLPAIKTKKKYRCLTALSDTTLVAGCAEPPSIDVLDLSGGVLRSVITPSTGQQLIQTPRYMCITRLGHILIVDAESRSLHCLTQQGLVIYRYKLTEGFGGCGGVTTTHTGSVIVADSYISKFIELTETGEYVRDVLTRRDGIDRPKGVRVNNNKLYVTEDQNEYSNCDWRINVTDIALIQTLFRRPCDRRACKTLNRNLKKQ